MNTTTIPLDNNDPAIGAAARIKVQATLNAAGEMMGLQGCDDLTEKLIPALRRVIADAALLKGLEEVCGHWQNSSDEPVTISQDDATRQYIITVGRRAIGSGVKNQRGYFAGSLRSALRLAIDGEKVTPHG